MTMTLNILFLTIKIERRTKSRMNQHIDMFERAEKNSNEKFNELLNMANLPNRW
jgi:hypothetical protein